MTAKRKERRHLIAMVSLLSAVMIALLFNGCADVRYGYNPVRSPEARYNTYYAPDYYPYFPWDGYYGGAYYYGESDL